MTLTLPFARGQLVVVVLHSPRERLWGRLLGLEAPGLALRGLDVAAWEEVLSLVRKGLGDQVSLSTRFLPMHRIESLYLDERSSGVPSLSEVFLERTGMDPGAFLEGGTP
ncbi:MAG: hypothetical protein HY823_12290 [Acidobacteria bacterium]|nr:hypothetical protein [Acidobacteriota bacterium]